MTLGTTFYIVHKGFRFDTITILDKSLPSFSCMCLSKCVFISMYMYIHMCLHVLVSMYVYGRAYIDLYMYMCVVLNNRFDHMK